MKLSFDLKVLLEMAYEQATKVKKGGRPGAERRKWAELEKLSLELVTKDYTTTTSTSTSDQPPSTKKIRARTQ